MKKLKITMMVIFAVLFSCLFVMGCDDPKPDTDTDNEVYAQGKVIILQAYGNAGDGSPEGVSHSFVELYNITDEDISLDGIGLYYANGTSVATGQTNNATKDGEWKRISLDGKTIPAKGSFLILGAKHSNLTNTRYKIDDNYGDINDNNLSLSRRGFKVALIQSTAELEVQNPFDTDGSWTVISGYIDMVGAANDYQGRDLIFGFEGEPARNSASEAVRRKNLTDTDDNSDDFIAARYASDANGMSDEELEVRKPRNSSVEEWDPFADPAEPGDEYEGLPPTTAGAQSAQAGKLLIFQIGAGAADNETNVTRSFVELYNAGETSVNLSGFTLQYAAGTKVAGEATRDGKWQKIDLSGTIEAGHSFLILGSKISTMPGPALDFEDDSYGDMYDQGFVLSNRAVKVALIQGANLLTVQNPFNMEDGKAAGYVDMIGVTNDGTDQILGLEGTTSLITGQYRITKQVGVRRTSLTDTDVNSADFKIVTYSSIRNDTDQFELMRPKNHTYGEWDPFAEPEPPEPTDNTLLILQVGAATDGNISRSFVELYNNGDTAVNLSGYSLQYAEGTRGNAAATEDGEWKKIDLTGTIPPYHSFLILGEEQIPETNLTPALLFENNYGDMNLTDFNISNRSFKVLLIQSTTLVTVQNPFDTGNGEKVPGYVDMVGAMNTTTGNNPDKINGYEVSAITDLNKQTGQRRTSLVDTDNNKNDFARAVFLNASPADLEILKPKNIAYGEWDPFAEPEPPEYQTTAGTPSPLAGQLLVLQAGAATNGAIARNFVELYNNTDSPITLTGTYSLQYTGATGADWTVINLDGTIPAHGSFLVVGKVAESHNDNRLFIADNEADQIVGDSFILSNNGFKVALMANQQKLTVANPFAMEGGKAADYVDMLGAYNSGTQPDGYETAHAAVISKQAAARRGSLTDTDDNSADFVRIDYRVQSGNNGISDDDVAKFRPRYSTYGTWTPEF